MTKTISKLAMAVFAIIGVVVIPAQALIKEVPITDVPTIGTTAIASEVITFDVITNRIQVNNDRLIVNPLDAKIARITDIRQITGASHPIAIGISAQMIGNGIKPIIQRTIQSTISMVIHQTKTVTILIV